MENKVVNPSEFFASWEAISHDYHAVMPASCNCQALKDANMAKLFPDPSTLAINCVVSWSAINAVIQGS